MFWCHNRSLLNVYDVETVIIIHRAECLKAYGWQWKMCDEPTIQFDSIQLDELLEVWREQRCCSVESTPYTRHCTSMYFTPHGVDFYLLHSMFSKNFASRATSSRTCPLGCRKRWLLLRVQIHGVYYHRKSSSTHMMNSEQWKLYNRTFS